MSTQGSSDTPPRRLQHAVSHSAPGAERGRDHLRRQDDAGPRCWPSRRVQRRKHGRCLKATIRLVICGSASGSMVPPTAAVGAKEHLSPEVTKAAEKAGFYSQEPTKQATTTHPGSASVFSEHFIRRRLQLPVLDNSGIHMTNIPLKTLAEADTHVFALPPSTTDHTRLLDVAVLRMVKSPPAATGEGTAATRRPSSVFGRPAGSVAERGPQHGRRPWSACRAG